MPPEDLPSDPRLEGVAPTAAKPSRLRGWIAQFRSFLREFSFRREIDLLSIAAFSLSMVVAVMTIGPYFAGPKLKLPQPVFAILFAEDYNGSEPTFERRQPQIRFIVDMSVVNLSYVALQAVVEKETLDFTLGGDTYHQIWRYATVADTERYHVHLCPDDAALAKLAESSGPLTGYRYDEPKVTEKAPVVFACHSRQQKLILWERRPMQRIVPATSAISQQVVFEGPGTNSKILPAKAFSDFLTASLLPPAPPGKPEKSVQSTLKISVYEAGKVTAITCTFTIAENERRLFVERGWFKIELFDKCS